MLKGSGGVSTNKLDKYDNGSHWANNGSIRLLTPSGTPAASEGVSGSSSSNSGMSASLELMPEQQFVALWDCWRPDAVASSNCRSQGGQDCYWYVRCCTQYNNRLLLAHRSLPLQVHILCDSSLILTVYLVSKYRVCVTGF